MKLWHPLVILLLCYGPPAAVLLYASDGRWPLVVGAFAWIMLVGFLIGQAGESAERKL